MPTVQQVVRSVVAPLTRTRLFRALGADRPAARRAAAARASAGGRVQLSGLLVPSLVLHTVGAKSGRAAGHVPHVHGRRPRSRDRGRHDVRAGAASGMDLQPARPPRRRDHGARAADAGARDAASARPSATRRGRASRRSGPGIEATSATRAGSCGSSGCSRWPTRITRRCDARGAVVRVRRPPGRSRERRRRRAGARHDGCRDSRPSSGGRPLAPPGPGCGRARGRATTPSGIGWRPSRGTSAMAISWRASSMSDAKSGSSATIARHRPEVGEDAQERLVADRALRACSPRPRRRGRRARPRRGRRADAAPAAPRRPRRCRRARWPRARARRAAPSSSCARRPGRRRPRRPSPSRRTGRRS